MYIEDIIWLPAIIDKLGWKHNVTPEEVDQALFASTEYRRVEKGHRPGEDVFAALGQTDSGRYLVIFFVYKQSDEALILSARDMDRRERNRYERRK